MGQRGMGRRYWESGGPFVKIDIVLLLLDHSCTYKVIMYECPSNHYSSCRSLSSLDRRRFGVLPRHCFDSILELD